MPTLWLFFSTVAFAGSGRALKDAEAALATDDVPAVLRHTEAALEAEAHRKKPRPTRQARAHLLRARALMGSVEPVEIGRSARNYARARALDPTLPGLDDVQLQLATDLTLRSDAATPTDRVTLLDALVRVRDDVRSHTLRCLAVPPDRVPEACEPALARGETSDRPQPAVARAVQRLALERLTAGQPTEALAYVERGERLLRRQRDLVASQRGEDADLIGPELDRAAQVLKLARLTTALSLPDLATEAADLLAQRLSDHPADPGLNLARGRLQLERAARMQRELNARLQAGETLAPAERTRIDMEAIGLYVEARDHLLLATAPETTSIEALLDLRTVLRALGEQDALTAVEDRLRDRLPSLP